jgi:ATP-dependent DNA helicase RecQ
MQLPSGLIFTYFVNDRTIGVSLLAQELAGQLGLPIGVFSGAQPFGMGNDRLAWERQKLTVQRQFKRNEVPILACTQAFGMGIDKPDIRFIIRTMLPRSLEEFYQQVGRAGRDRKPARCILIFSDDQPFLADEILDTENTTLEEISGKAEEVRRNEQGDAIRNTWFLTNSFLGRDVEKRLLHVVIDRHIGPNLPRNIGDKIIVEIPFNALPDGLIGNSKKTDYSAKDTALEKALYRLLLVGGISDYMKDYSARKFLVELARRADFLISTGNTR